MGEKDCTNLEINFSVVKIMYFVFNVNYTCFKKMYSFYEKS